MRRDTVFVKKFLPYALWDMPGLQAWLNEQAQKGYALERWPGWSFIGRVHFRREADAVHTRYCLDPIGERIGEAELRDRAASYEEYGWHYAGKVGKLYAIYRCDDPNAEALYSDPESLAWAMKRQLRWAWVGLFLLFLWVAVIFRNEWRLLFRWPEEFLLELILRADVLIPLYAVMLVFVLDILLGAAAALLRIRRVRACLGRGEWPKAGPRRYPEPLRFLLVIGAAGVLILYLAYLGISGAQHTRVLPGPEAWDFPHVTLAEVLPKGAELRPFSHREMHSSDTFRHSLLAPEQYDVVEGGTALPEDGAQVETLLVQEHIRAASPALARAVYRGQAAAQRRSLEEYRVYWEENVAGIHSDCPSAYAFVREEPLSRPGLEGLTRFVYQFSKETRTHTVYIGLAGERVFVLHCSGAADGDDALELLVRRLGEEEG